MHIMEPPDLFERYLDPKFKHRVTAPIGADGRPKRGLGARSSSTACPAPVTPTAAVPQAAEGRRHPEHPAALGLPAGRHRPPRFRHRAELRRRGSGDGHGDGGRRHRRPLPDQRALDPHRARQHGPAALAGPLPGLQQLDPRVLPLQPRAAQVRGDAADARRPPRLPRAASAACASSARSARSSGRISSTATTGTRTTGIRSTACTRS